MTLGVAVEGAATSSEYADNLVPTPVVNRCLDCMAPLIKAESVFGRLGKAEAFALGSQEDP